MKTYLILIMITVVFGIISSKAQTPVISITDFSQELYEIDNAYYKDTENFLNNFEGTWLWQDGNNVLTLEFKKVEQFYRPSGSIHFYEDILVGEFKYVENGVVVADHLNAMNTGPFDFSRNIKYSTVINNNMLPACTECDEGEYRVRLFFHDPNFPEFSSILVLRHGVQWWNQQKYIIARLFIYGTYVGNSPNSFGEISIPEGTYTLFKQ